MALCFSKRQSPTTHISKIEYRLNLDSIKHFKPETILLKEKRPLGHQVVAMNNNKLDII